MKLLDSAVLNASSHMVIIPEKPSCNPGETMANKENLSPRSGGSPRLGDDTPPASFSTALGIRHWQHAAYASTPFGLLSPNSKPSLARQRDHSACGKADSPLKVRKTRENLRETSIIAEIPPPCVHASSPCEAHERGPPPALSFTSATTMNSSIGDLVGLGEHNDMTGTTLVSAASSLYESHPAPPVSRPLHIPGKMVRHKSVSRRMLSRVKEGITNRSRSSHSMRHADAETGLMRRWSGKRKKSGEEHSRLPSFEISRDSIESQEHVPDEVTQRSFTDSSISTDELMATLINLTPPPSVGVGSRRPSSALLPTSSSPEPRTSDGEPTPRAVARASIVAPEQHRGLLPAVVPFIDLQITADRDAVDVSASQEVWVAVEATVRTKLVETNSASGAEAASIVQPLAIDAVVAICQEILDAYADLSQQCLIELSSKLNVPGDRLAVLVAKSTRLNATTIRCECAELHSLQPPRTASLLDKLGFSTSTARDSRLCPIEEWQPLQVALETVAPPSNRKGVTHAFVISSAPKHLVEAISSATGWPTHALKLGLDHDQDGSISTRNKHLWSLEFQGEGDTNFEILDNMYRDLRYDCNAGVIPSLRLCYKAMQDARITEVVGEKVMKDLTPGKRCSLFVKVKIPKIETDTNHKETDQDSLFAELKSIVGTLESNFLHVEARYRHTALPLNNVATVRQICSIKRPKTESRWSLSATSADKVSMENVHTKLARFLSSHYPPAKALKLISHWDLITTKRVLQVSQYLEPLERKNKHACAVETSPTVVVTDADTNHTTTPIATPSALSHATSATDFEVTPSDSPKLPQSSSSNTMVPNRTISPSMTITAVSLSAGPSSDPNTSSAYSRREVTPTDTTDSARQLWHHIRRNSLSATQILEMSPNTLQYLEATDPALKELRDKAIANKRSVGAETLKAWKWDGKMREKMEGEAPWL